MKKNSKIIILAAAVIVVALGIFLYSALFTTATRTAYLMIEEGNIEVDHGDGWVEAEDMMDLSLNDKIRTNEGKATVVFYDSIIVNLDSSTEISIKELSQSSVEVQQESGSTWHKFTKIVGVDDYKVSTPKAVATIRGTEAGVEVGEEETFMLGEGDFSVNIGGETAMLDPLQVLVISPDGTFRVREIDIAQRQKALEFMRRNLAAMKKVRMNEIEAHSGIVTGMIEKYGEGRTVEEVVDDIDKGQIDDNTLVEKAPVRIPALHKVKAINDEVKKSQWVMRQMEEGATGQQIRERIKNRPYLIQ